jgi:hypothetical protein
MLADRYDLPLSTVYAAARDAYVQGVILRLPSIPARSRPLTAPSPPIPVSPWPMLARPRY